MNSDTPQRRALDLLETGRSVRDVAASLGIAESCLHRWKSRDLLERGVKAATAQQVESAALAAARARIAELETEVKILRKAAAAVEQVVPPKARFALVAELAAEGVPVKQACVSLGVSRSGFYEAQTRPPSARTIRQAWLTDQITAIHEASRQTYGAPRVRAELVLAQGVIVSRKTVAALMRRARLAGLPLRRKAKRVPPAITVTDLVKRDFRRHGPNQLWVTDITEHPTREGKLYCCVVLDAYSRRVVGWAIDARQRADLATAALGMAIDARGIAGQIPGGIIHGDHGTQFTSWTFTERARRAGLLPSLGSVGDPYDNAVAEAFWARMQTELLDRQRWRTRVELANAIFEYIEGFYNRRRRHSALDWLSPVQFETIDHPSAPVSSPTSP
ncbi:IS3 family transposase [Pseudonocardia asaccharolytica]|uniref:IS3 family transposase n=2 Tax=Pseudonocardia asaccharolytica TaxID=54010 RepID=UPI000A04DA37|nr:IS3 family transposase [Pseudonocardia asaccharolytica]